MKFLIDTSGRPQTGSGLLIIACFADDFQSGVAPKTRSLAALGQTSLMRAASEQEFAGKSGQLLSYFADRSALSGSVLLLGVGDRGTFSLNSLKDALAKAYRKAKETKSADVVFDAEPVLALGVDPYELGRLLGCYAVLIDHNQKHYKTAHSNPKGDFNVRTLKVHAPLAVASKLKDGLAAGRSLASGVTLARDLVTMPAGHLTPFKLMEAAKGVVARSKGLITGNYFWGKRLEQMGAHALLAVARGSSEAPVLIELDYTPETGPTTETLCLIGKSVTFDSGGLDLKPADGMRNMKRDMAGGAAVLGAIQAIAALNLPISVKVVMAATENMPDGKSFKPGDVIGTMKGLSVEIDNTDGEGRLTLADAIEFAKRRGAKRIVDFATLTGAVKSISGDIGAAAFGNHPDFTQKVVKAGATVGELMIDIPMWEELRKANETDIADLKNSGGGGAGSTTAAWFIREFAGEEIDWVHVDIAGVAWRERSLGIDPKGATGWGVRTAVALAESLAVK
ncbi:MAG: M17 family peptidase N-terminal domain-containing protein [Candidatus Melainabacteria bacterium]|nr:M17 family peptidase N-terminal domain-containing protein [Candidatus Melainabacteria bacterium]